MARHRHIAEAERQQFDILAARQWFGYFCAVVAPEMQFLPFHIAYYRILNEFAHGRIRRLIITMPPQHGKSQGSTRFLPAYLLGISPDRNIAVASYSDRFAQKFNRDVQRIIDMPEYRAIFPDTALAGGGTAHGRDNGNYIRTASEFEIVGHRGGLKAVGRGGGLTGNRVDCLVLDDLYKDAMEGNSPTVRAAAWEWYTSVCKTRLHNASQELIVFTRWHEEDIIGELLKREQVREIRSWEDVRDMPANTWAYLNFEAIKVGGPTEIDPRDEGMALWEERHSLSSLVARRALNEHQFECMYQGHPTAAEGYLYGTAMQTYEQLPPTIKKRAAYVDSADTGEDYLCAIAYAVGSDDIIYITDILYTTAPMEQTEPATAALIMRNDIRVAMIESNNGGRGFARNVQRLAPRVRVEWFHQSGNKEARILSNSATVLHNVCFPADWALRWPDFHAHISTFKRIFAANKHDDGADALTGVVEQEYGKAAKGLKYFA